MKKTMIILNSILLLSIVIIVSYFISFNMEEWITGAGRVFDVIERLSEAYVASYVFFFIIEFLPYKRKKKYAEIDLDIVLYRIVYNLSQLFILIAHGANKEVKFDEEILSPKLDIFKEIDEIVFSEKNICNIFLGSKVMIFLDFPVGQSFSLVTESIKSNISRIIAYSEYVDEELQNILNSILLSDLLESVSKSENKRTIEKILKTRIDEVNTLYGFYNDLNDFMKSNEYAINSRRLISNHNKK